MEVSKKDWDNFWKFIERANNFKISGPKKWMHITFNLNTGKVEFLDEATAKKGELSKEDFKKLFGKHADYLLPYIRGDKKMPDDPPNDTYVANIIRHYFKWLA